MKQYEMVDGMFLGRAYLRALGVPEDVINHTVGVVLEMPPAGIPTLSVKIDLMPQHLTKIAEELQK